jgi:ABC-2 type transport system ATP-binding protein
MTEAIAVTGLVKTFGRARALSGLDLHVTTGEVHGFLGPNGAGKTTTIRILLGLLRPDSGRCCSAATRGAKRCGCTGGSPTCPAT